MIFVVGGGVVGAAVAREAAGLDAVLVGSPTERAHVGFWRRFGPGDTPPANARVFVCAPVPAPTVREWAQRRRVTVVGRDVPGVVSVLASPVWDVRMPVFEALRRQGRATIPRAMPSRRWLWSGDLARVALLVDVSVSVCGPEALDGAQVASRLSEGGRRCEVGWLRGPELPADPVDGWVAEFGARRRLGRAG